ncbi:MAG TPA: aspartate carbamoyltransferase catalytic subunit [Pseudobdellovibrionaceae bacterium]|nr:aspartate carbamoyltransferase catalytic subunit [Pseudobdellovibrionaceae bacterium]
MSVSSLIDLKSLTAEALSRIFSLSKNLSLKNTSENSGKGRTAGLVFFEPSTRTRLSFEFACAREGVAPVTLSGEAGSSLEKGETPEDTVLNVAAMKPDVLIIRCGDGLDLEQLSRNLPMPILNAGWGKRGHPTQALLDAYAMMERWGTLEGRKLLIVGDVRHSRVAASHFELSRILGYEVAIAGPEGFLPKDPVVPIFENLEEGLRWADAVMSLRVQTERHQNPSDLASFLKTWGLDHRKLKALKSDGLIMHPGPVNWGVEMSIDVPSDPRTIILNQVTGGVFVRQALVRWALEGK